MLQEPESPSAEPLCEQHNTAHPRGGGQGKAIGLGRAWRDAGSVAATVEETGAG